MRTDLTLLDNHELLLALGRERAVAERRGCPTLGVDPARVPLDPDPGCACHRLLAIEAEIERRLGDAPVSGGVDRSEQVDRLVDRGARHLA